MIRKVFASEKAARRAGIWFCAAAGQDWAKERNELGLTKALAENVNSAGGFLVPQEISDRIIELRDGRGIFRQNAFIESMTSDSTSVPRRLTGGITAFFTNEGVAITESSGGTWDSITLTAKKLSALVRSSNELVEDSAPRLAESLVREISYQFADREDSCGFNGTGAQVDGGIRGLTTLLTDGSHNAGKVAAAAGHPTFKLLDGTDIAAVIAALPSFALSGAAWYISNFGYATTFCRLAASSGGLVSTTVNGVTSREYLGWPVKISSTLPQVGTSLNGSVMLLFGNLAMSSTIGDRTGVEIKTSTQRLLENDQTYFRGRQRFDLCNHDMGDNTNAGPIVGLVGTT